VPAYRTARALDRVRELNAALAQVKQLQGLLPMCAWRKNIRNDGNYWQSVEGYFAELSDIRFSYGICPRCMARESAASDEGHHGDSAIEVSK